MRYEIYSVVDNAGMTPRSSETFCIHICIFYSVFGSILGQNYCFRWKFLTENFLKLEAQRPKIFVGAIYFLCKIRKTVLKKIVREQYKLLIHSFIILKTLWNITPCYSQKLLFWFYSGRMSCLSNWYVWSWKAYATMRREAFFNIDLIT